MILPSIFRSARRSRVLVPALLATFAFAAAGRVEAQSLPLTILDRVLALETDNSQQSADILSAASDLLDLRSSQTTIERTVGDQGSLLDLGIADLDALSLDVADLRSTLGTIDVDILSNNARDDRQDTILVDHERRITTNTTDIASVRSTVTDHTATLLRHEGEIAEVRSVTAVHTTEIAALRDDTNDNTRRLDGHDRDISDLRQEVGTTMQGFRSELDAQSERIDTATEGVAMAFALNGPAVAADRTFALSGGFGNFEGRNAFAVSGGVRANDTIQFDGGLAVGLESGSVGGRAGATISW